MYQSAKIKETTGFIADYAAVLLGSGVHCTRVLRNSRRICEAYGLELTMTIFASNIILTLSDPEQDEICTEVVHIRQLPVSFELNAELSALSWRVFDNRLSIDEVKQEYGQIMQKPRMNHWLVTLLVSVANACFCRLFGGDWGAMGLVFISTFAGFRLLRFVKKRGIDHSLAVILVSFFSSFACIGLASLPPLAGCVNVTVAVATSVLFMVPGVPLITGVIDIFENHVLIGFARLMRAILIMLCLAVGLSISMVIFSGSLQL